MPSRENLPRVMVMIQEKNIDYIHWHFQTKTINSAEAIILKALELKGFKLINLNLMLPRLTAEDEKDFYGDDAKKIAQLGKSFGADVVITGKAISRSVVTLELKGDSVSAVAMVTLKAIRTLDGLQLASTSTSASASDISESEAGSLAITNASEEAILNMTSEIMEQWAEGLEPVMDITLYVSGLKSIESLVQFKNEFLNSVPGVKTFEKRTFSGGAAAYDIQSTTDVAKMVADLKEKQLESFEVTVRSYSSNSLDLSVRMK
jgi:hypothetical protein